MAEDHTNDLANSPAFRLDQPIPKGVVAIEASAGTGKTFTLASLAVRLILEEEVPIAQVLLVTFTRAAAAELAERVRARLLRCGSALAAAIDGHYPDSGALLEYSLAGPEVGQDLLRSRLSLAQRALSEFDSATISTIHGFAQQMLGLMGRTALHDQDAELADDGGQLLRQVINDLLVEHALDGSMPPQALDQAKILAAANLIQSNAGIAVAPDLLADHQELSTMAEPDLALVTARLRLVEESLRRCRVLRQTSKSMSFDDLLTSLRDVLCSPESSPGDLCEGDLSEGVGPVESARAALRSRFSVALIDEFQDTDAVQWQIFDALFGSGSENPRLVLVGDPKQAIYSFRGADIHTYRAAIATAQHHFTLDTNWRSDAGVLNGLAALFQGLRFGSADIVFRPVRASPLRQKSALTVQVGPPIAPVAVRIPAFEEQLKSAPAQRAVARDCALHIADLLDRGLIPTTAGSVSPEESESSELRPVEPRDIAILLKAKSEAPDLQRQLQLLGIDSVVMGAGSVLESPAAMHWYWLLDAIAQPADQRRVKTAALSWFVGWTAEELATVETHQLGELQERFQAWGELLVGRGVNEFLRRVRGESAVLQQVLARVDGERNLTDIDHCSELLARSAPRNVGPAGLLQTLEKLRVASSEGGEDPAARRIESEANAVQILTAHVSKGLEFPVVCVPMFFKAPLDPKDRVVFASPTGSGEVRRCVDIANDCEWPDKSGSKRRKELAKVEVDGEQMRLLYVAMTRASHHCAVWYQSYLHSAASPCAKLLFSRDASGALLVSETGTVTRPAEPRAAEVSEGLTAVVASAQGGLSAEVVQVPTRLARRMAESSAVPNADLQLAQLSRPLDRRAIRHSFSSLTRGAHELIARVGQSGDSEAQARVSNDAVGLVAAEASVNPLDELGLRGGADEPDRSLDVSHLDQPETGPVEAASLAGPLPMGGFRGANIFGTLVHDVLEITDFTAPDVVEQLTLLCGDQILATGLEIVPSELAQALALSLKSPLGDLFGGTSLRQLENRNRLNEMRFQLQLGAGLEVRVHHRSVGTSSAGTSSTSHSATSHSATRQPVPTVEDIATLIVHHLQSDDPLRPWADNLARTLNNASLLGHLEGFVDLIARVPNPDGSWRYVVVDYKTNNLTPTGEVPRVEHYGPENLAKAMGDHHYPLQALLYSVALHRYLRYRIPDYSPQVHLGGIAYLFLRGMAGPEVPQPNPSPWGVFSWRPPVALIEELCGLLHGQQSGRSEVPQ